MVVHHVYYMIVILPAELRAQAVQNLAPPVPPVSTTISIAPGVILGIGCNPEFFTPIHSIFGPDLRQGTPDRSQTFGATCNVLQCTLLELFRMRPRPLGLINRVSV